MDMKRRLIAVVTGFAVAFREFEWLMLAVLIVLPAILGGVSGGFS